MDHFEQELARMMRDSQEDMPYEDRHRRRLRAGVRARRRNRTAWTATGSVLTVAGLGVGLVILANSFAQGGPTGPQPRPVTSAESVLPRPATARPASTAAGVPSPYRVSIPGQGPLPGQTSTR
ncbi:cellulase [Streptomyces sp. NPDC005492]|uniref:cellulase n=1 Tax=Streptomyces sp. NPDC005492 TaxID=3156883 RepID=UPI0033BE7657